MQHGPTFAGPSNSTTLPGSRDLASSWSRPPMPSLSAQPSPTAIFRERTNTTTNDLITKVASVNIARATASAAKGSDRYRCHPGRHSKRRPTGVGKGLATSKGRPCSTGNQTRCRHYY